MFKPPLSPPTRCWPSIPIQQRVLMKCFRWQSARACWILVAPGCHSVLGAIGALANCFLSRLDVDSIVLITRLWSISGSGDERNGDGALWLPDGVCCCVVICLCSVVVCRRLFRRLPPHPPCHRLPVSLSALRHLSPLRSFAFEQTAIWAVALVNVHGILKKRGRQGSGVKGNP